MIGPQALRRPCMQSPVLCASPIPAFPTGLITSPPAALLLPDRSLDAQRLGQATLPTGRPPENTVPFVDPTPVTSLVKGCLCLKQLWPLFTCV